MSNVDIKNPYFRCQQLQIIHWQYGRYDFWQVTSSGHLSFLNNATYATTRWRYCVVDVATQRHRVVDATTKLKFAYT